MYPHFTGIENKSNGKLQYVLAQEICFFVLFCFDLGCHRAPAVNMRVYLSSVLLVSFRVLLLSEDLEASLMGMWPFLGYLLLWRIASLTGAWAALSGHHACCL